MADAHNYSFFGQNTGIILNSKKDDLAVWLKCIKRKPDGVWEKPSAGEGKSAKLGIEENIMILEVLNKRALNWTTYHSYGDAKTSISFSWEDEKATKLWINIGEYSKMLNKPQAELLRRLLNHIVKEQVEFGTVQKPKAN